MLVSFISQFPACSPFSVGQGVSTIEVRYLIVLTISEGPKNVMFLPMRCTLIGHPLPFRQISTSAGSRWTVFASFCSVFWIGWSCQKSFLDLNLTPLVLISWCMRPFLLGVPRIIYCFPSANTPTKMLATNLKLLFAFTTRRQQTTTCCLFKPHT